MRIVIDMQGAQTNASAHRGVGRYTISLVKALLKLDTNHEFFLLMNGCYPESLSYIRSELQGLNNQCEFKVWHQYLNFCGIDPSSHLNMKIAEIIRESLILSLSPDIVFSTNLQEGLAESAPTSVKIISNDYISITTLHDVIPLINRDQYLSNPLVHNWYKEKINFVKKSNIILTDSESSKNEIHQYAGIELEKIFVIHCAVDDLKYKKLNISNGEKKAFLEKLGLPKKYVLYVGGADIHKDLITLYKAYAALPEITKNNFKLVLVGKEIKYQESKIRKTLNKLGINQNVLIVGKLSELDLIYILNLASLFVFPSTHEGFGLPPLEAMACGTPVLISSAPSLVEIVSNAEAIFPVGNFKTMAEKMEDILNNPNLAKQLSERGVVRAKNFTWENSAKKLLDIFENAPANLSNKLDPYVGIDIAIKYISDLLCEAKATDDVLLKLISKNLDANFPPSNRHKHLFLDISAIILNGDHTGIQRVVRAICMQILNFKENEYEVRLVFTEPGVSEHFLAFKTEENWRNNIVDSYQTYEDTLQPVVFYPEDILLYLDLHPSVSIAHSSKNTYLKNSGIKVFHTVYDLLPIQLPDKFPRDVTSEFEKWLESIFCSSGAICISKSVSKELEAWKFDKFLGENFDIEWFHLGADIEKSVPTLGYDENNNFIMNEISNGLTFLMVGTLEARKGHEQVLDAFEILWSSGLNLNLVIVGKQGWMVESLILRMNKHPLINKKLFWLKGISDEYLSVIYDSATCLISASYGEGFGLPLIEAARHKLPLLVRDLDVFREVAGDSAYYFNTSKPNELADVVKSWIFLFDNNAHPKSENINWLTWKESAEMLFDTILNT